MKSFATKMFHLIPLRLFKPLNLVSLFICIALTAVYFHFNILHRLEQEANEMTNLKNHRTLSFSQFKQEYRSCYISNKTSGDPNLNDNIKAFIHDRNNIPISTIFLTFWFIYLVKYGPGSCCIRDVELMKSGFASFSENKREAKHWWRSFPLASFAALFTMASLGYGFHFFTLSGHFFDLGIRFLNDPNYLSELFPDLLYCYRFNEKREERFVSTFMLNNNGRHGRLYLVFWFWMVIYLPVQSIIFVQVVCFSHSKFYRFMRLKRLFPSVDERLLRRLSERDFTFCTQLEFFEFYASNRQDFREFVDYLVKRDYFSTRVVPETSTLSNGDREDPDAMALVLVKT